MNDSIIFMMMIITRAFEKVYIIRRERSRQINGQSDQRIIRSSKFLKNLSCL